MMNAFATNLPKTPPVNTGCVIHGTPLTIMYLSNGQVLAYCPRCGNTTKEEA